MTTVTYRRPLHTNEPINDRPVSAQGETSVVAAIGPLNARMEANAHAVNDKTNGIVFYGFIFIVRFLVEFEENELRGLQMMYV